MGTGLLFATGLASAGTRLAAFTTDGASAVGVAAGIVATDTGPGADAVAGLELVVGGVEGAEAPEGDGLAEEGAGAAADEAAGEGVDEAGAGEAGVEGGLLVCGLDDVEPVAYNSKIMVLRLLAECV